MNVSILSELPDRGGVTDVDPPRWRRRWLALLTVGVLAATGAGAWYWLQSRAPAVQPALGDRGPVATAKVTRQTVTDTGSWSGKLGHGRPHMIRAGGSGTLTGLPDTGTTITRGTELYRLDEQPVVALIGTVPAYRDLEPGDEGVDVRQLEQNLTDLGYEGFSVDDVFTSSTAQAVEQWQADIGAKESGSVRRSDVVFLPRAGQVETPKVAIGDVVNPGTEILGIVGAKQIVALNVDVSERELVDVGTPVQVRLPGGTETKGTVTSAAVVEDTSGEDGGDGGGGDADGGGGDGDAGADKTTTQVEVTLGKPVDEALLGSPVDVVVNVETRENVLVVPVTALLGLAEGGYGVEVVKGNGATEIVTVEPGLFADGKVEISGKDIDEGTVVGVAGR